MGKLGHLIDPTSSRIDEVKIFGEETSCRED